MNGRRLRATAERAIAVASRAPSAHNTQPWVPRIVGAGPESENEGVTVSVSIDPDRTLPLADPWHMDTLLGMGCWVEAFVIACRERDAHAALTDVSGTGANTIVTLTVSAGSDRHMKPNRPGVRDVTARGVDRGRLLPDDAALEAAIGDFLAPGTRRPLRVRVVPEPLWQDLNALAALHIAGSPAMLDETLAWLRLDRGDPRWYRDGLTAECLRMPAPAAAALSRVLRSPLGTAVVRNTDSWRPLLERGLGGSRRVQRIWRRTARGDARVPTRIVLGTSVAASAEEVTARDWVLLGRELMTLWLVLHRHGLRVQVQSELKDSPATAPALARVLGGGDWVPFATFSTGRSASPVPRSHRRPAAG